jgi:hypothetical protein
MLETFHQNRETQAASIPGRQNDITSKYTAGEGHKFRHQTKWSKAKGQPAIPSLRWNDRQHKERAAEKPPFPLPNGPVTSAPGP